jgi:hypothetical protein
LKRIWHVAAAAAAAAAAVICCSSRFVTHSAMADNKGIIISVVPVKQFRPSWSYCPPLCSSFRSSQSPPSSLLGGIEVLDDDDNNIGNDATMGKMAGPQFTTGAI